MRKILLSSILLSSVTAFAANQVPANNAPAVQALQGSDTLAGFMSDLIIASGLEEKLVYQGGGSGKGEEAIAAGLQGIAALSRVIKPEVLAKAEKAGITLTEHNIGLDGIGIFVHDGNAVKELSLPQVASIFTCKVTNWKELGGADAPIVVYRRNDLSGTTDTFKSLTGVKEFGACVTILSETSDIAVATSTEEHAVAYAGLSAGRPGENHALALSKDGVAKAVAPTVSSIQKFTYPLARRLYVYEAGGAYTLTEAETNLLTNLLDRSFADPILVDAEFFTLD